MNKFKTYKIGLLLALMLIAGFAYSQSEAKQVRRGNRQYDDNKFNDAEIDYRKALEKMPLSYRALYNLGDALYQQGSYEESANSFLDLTQKQTGDDLKAKAFYNLGNSKLQHAVKSDTLQPQQKVQKLAESIEAYKNCLKINPADNDAKYNLTYAKKKLAEYEQQCQGQCENKDEQKDQDKKEDQEKKDQEQQQDDKKQEQEKQEEKQGKESKELSKEEAERMLEAMKDDEKNTLEKVKKKKVKTEKTNIEKDW